MVLRVSDACDALLLGDVDVTPVIVIEPVQRLYTAFDACLSNRLFVGGALFSLLLMGVYVGQ